MTTESELERNDSVISYEEHIIPELMRLSPGSYPCIVYMESQDVRFIVKTQIEQWAKAMKCCM
jgi:hypothetical protein